MNDREIELRLRERLHRSLVTPDAPEALYDHVGRLGANDPGSAREWRSSGRLFSGRRAPSRARYGARVLSGLGVALAIAALLAVSLAWRPSNGRNPLAGASASASASAAAATPSSAQSASPSAAATTGRAWDGPAAQIAFDGRVDSRFGWVVTLNPGKLYLTEDGGQTWQDRTPADVAGNFELLAPSGTAGPWGVRFADSQHGWVVYQRNLGNDSKGLRTTGYDVYRTADGGRTWAKTPLPNPATYGLLEFFVGDDQHEWASLWGYDEYQAGGLPGPLHGQFWGSADGGASWSLLSSAELGLTYAAAGTAPSNLKPWPASGHFVSSDEGWALSDPTTLMHTVDGGRSWTTSQLPLPAGADSTAPAQVERFPTASGTSLTVSGEVWPSKTSDQMTWVSWTSRDGGAHWAISATTKLSGLETFQPAGHPDTNTIAYYDRTGSPILIRLFDTDTAALTSSLDVTRVCGSEAGVGRVSVANATDLWVTCDGRSGLYGTVDGGATWRSLMGQPSN